MMRLEGSQGSGLRCLCTVALVATLSLSGCGGGGGSSTSSGGTTTQSATSITLSLSTNSLSVSATTLQSAPADYFVVNALGLRNGNKVYIQESHSSSGIYGVQNRSGSFLPVTAAVQFVPPDALNPGTYHDQITINMCTDQACTQPVLDSPQVVNVTYTVKKAVYALTAISPVSVDEQAAAFTLTATGSNFTPQSVVLWNGSPRTTQYVSSTELKADITTTDIAAPSTASVTVQDPAYHTTSPQTFKVIRPALALGSISPAIVTVGGLPFTLTVLGDGFSSHSTVQWNGTALTTTYVSVKELLAQVPAGNIGSLGTASITVDDATGTPTAVGPQSLAIAAASKDAVSYQMNSAHTGAVNFNNLAFPSAAAWATNVGGTPSYAIIAQGEVIVTVSTSSGEKLVALDQTTGSVVWGPIAIANQNNATYENGRVFTFTGSVIAPTLTAYDAATGDVDWSTPISDFIDMIPTAADGLVFVTGYQADTLYAFDEATGTKVWSQNGSGGLWGSPAVTADGVYTTYGCTTYDVRPATGEVIWKQVASGPCGGGRPAVVANGLVYSPFVPNSYSGDAYDAETGTDEGSYTAATDPAFSASMGYYLQSGNLVGVTLSDNTVQWSFAGDGHLFGNPIAVDQYVFIASVTGNLYAVDSATGTAAWTVTAGSIGIGSNVPMMSALAAGDGLLVVPVGNTVTAYVLSTNP